MMQKAKAKKVKKYKMEEYTPSMIENPSVVDRVVDVVVILICILVALCSFIPMWHVAMSSLSDGKLLITHEGLVLLPIGEWTLAGYQHLFKNSGILQGYANSLINTAAATGLGFAISAVTGYALSRQTRLKGVMTAFIMFPMLFSGGLVPTYMVIRSLGWVGTRWALIIPGCTNAMFSIMMMNAYNSVPASLYEAARIDGASHFRTMLQVMLPQAMNMGSVMILQTVVAQWNSWLNAKIYVPNNKALWPLQLWINTIVADNENFLRTANPDYGRYLIQYAVIMAATLPLLVTFPFFQDKLEHAVIGGGVKG